MTIENSTFPDGIPWDWSTDSSRLPTDGQEPKIMHVGTYKIKPPPTAQLEQNYQLQVFKDGTGILRDLNGNTIYQLTQENRPFILSDNKSPMRHVYMVLSFKEGQSPKK